MKITIEHEGTKIVISLNDGILNIESDELALDPAQTTLTAFKQPTVIPTTDHRGRPKGAKDLQKREPSHCSTCGAAHRKASMRRAGADGRPHCIECDPYALERAFLFGGV